jgi:hypothetical protein
VIAVRSIDPDVLVDAQITLWQHLGVHPTKLTGSASQEGQPPGFVS